MSASRDDDASALSTPHLDRGQSGQRQPADRNSDDTTASAPLHNLPASVESSATTSASSLSAIQDGPASPPDDGDSPGSSIIERELFPPSAPIPEFSYQNHSSGEDDSQLHHQHHHHQHHHHHHQFPPESSSPRVHSGVHSDGAQTPSALDLAADTSGVGGGIGRHLTPTTVHARIDSLPRPPSTYSAVSDIQRGRSPGLMPGGSALREHSVSSRKSPDVRPSSYAELLNTPYPQQGPAPISLDNSLLRNAVGNNASLLSAARTLEMYRQNVKKTSDFSVQYSFAVFLISTAQEQGLDFSGNKNNNINNSNNNKGGRKNQAARDQDSGPASLNDDAGGGIGSSADLLREARGILQKLANAGYPFAQYYLADGFASGILNKGKEDHYQAFPLFVLAAKHGHAESGYRAALSYEFGWGCRRDPSKSLQFLRSAASKRHPGAMTRLGKACLSGDLGEKRYREGLKWLKLAAEAADAQYNAAPYQLGCLYETGYGEDIFRDPGYAAALFTQAADLGNAEASFRMGDAYEHGDLNCPRDPALSVHFYTGAAELGHAGAMMGLCAWYMVGAPPILEKDEEEAYEWARRSAEMGHVKAQYAIGYFTEMGIGCRRDPLEANVWYVKAADAGDDRAKQRLAVIQAAASGQTPAADSSLRPQKLTKGNKDDSCVVM